MTREATPPADGTTFASRWRGRPGGGAAGFYVLVSALLLLPCYWQPRIQAGDLSSHIYNTWLAQLIESGRAEGLVVVSQFTNVLFDLLLGGLFRLAGAEFAQRIAVSLAVLVLVWGAFAFACVVSRRRPWHLMPCLAMLAYGWVFHMGFFNFYLSLGLCFWALAAAWHPGRARLLAAAATLLLAVTAHALPVVWTVGLVLYLRVARRVAPRRRVFLTAGSLAAMAGAHMVLTSTFVSHWSPVQVIVSTGADQLWVFDWKYFVVRIGLLGLWGLLFLRLMLRQGTRRMMMGIPFQVCVLSAATVIALPNALALPGYHHAFVYIAERMSLGVGVCLCALLAAAQTRLWERCGIAALAGIFFVFLYVDERALNRFEDQMQGVVASLPPGQRVLSTVTDPSLRANALDHVIDRVCLGRCFSYGNYEPSTAQFRVRTVHPNPYVVFSDTESWALHTGKYVVRERDLPVWKVDADPSGRLVTKPLKAGSPCGSTSLQVLPRGI